MQITRQKKMNKASLIKPMPLLAILSCMFSCNGPIEKNLPKEKVSESGIKSVEHPKLIKTIGDPRYGNVRCSLQDKAGNLWFGTTENGLYKYDGKTFSRFLVADGLNSNNISSILEDKEGKIWIGSNEGLCIYGPLASHSTNDKTFTKIQLPLPPNPAPNKDDPYYSSGWVYSIMQAKNGKLWFITRGGVYIYNGISFTMFNINEFAKGILSSDFKPECILEDKAGNIWFGGRTNEGVYCYDGKSVTNLKLKELFQDGPKPKAHNWAWPQLQDKDGNIWFSNWGGAYRYDPSASLSTGSESFTSFTKEDGLSGVTRIIEDKKGNLWFGGDAGAGFSRYDPSASLRTGSKSFTRFTTKDGLFNNSIWSILEDKTGNLWVGTRETGLYLYDGKTFITYSEYKHQPPTN